VRGIDPGSTCHIQDGVVRTIEQAHEIGSKNPAHALHSARIQIGEIVGLHQLVKVGRVTSPDMPRVRRVQA
jgi:hypothetical protein